MKKFYLVNYSTIEVTYFNSSVDAFKEAQRRNRLDRNANWKAYDENENVIYGVYVGR